MKLTGFRVQNYRSILDSGWVEFQDIVAVVGKNEAGKTSLLKALWKLNPFKAEPFSLDREWPRGRRKDRKADAIVVTGKFEFTEAQRQALVAIDSSLADITTVEVSRRYDGKFSVAYQPHGVPLKRSGITMQALLEGAFRTAAEGKEAAIRTIVDQIHGGVKEKMRAAMPASIPAIIAEVKATIVSRASELDPALVQTLSSACDTLTTKSTESLWDAVWSLVHKWMPTFIYMDDFLAFKGMAHLDQIKARRDNNQLQDDDRTIITIMEMAGLDLDEEVAKGAQNDREQRMLDMNDASQTLTNEIAARWSQKKYEVQFQADGHHFITFVKDEANKALVPLEERSKGFQWFFSFDMKFMYETEGDFEGAVILLDEPGMHLHAAAQRDLLVRMKAYAKTNQLVYTTHLPFMIDMERLDNIWVAEERGAEGTVVHHDWATADKEARFTLQAALGLNWAQSLFVGQRNLVVEGVTDFWFLVTMSTLLKASGDVGLPENLVITPAGGASKVAYVATLLVGQQLKVAALLDSDPEGFAAQKQLVHNWLLKEGNVLLLGEIAGVEHSHCALEDLFDEHYYISQTASAYKKELGGKEIKLPAKPPGSIVDRLDTYFTGKALTFNKGRVAKAIMLDMAQKTIADVPEPTVTAFKKVIGRIVEIDGKWEKEN